MHTYTHIALLGAVANILLWLCNKSCLQVYNDIPHICFFDDKKLIILIDAKR